MKKNRLRSKFILLFPACLSAMLFFGCKAGGAEVSASPAPVASITPSAAPSPTAGPTPSEEPAETPAASATPFAVNPVYAFYAEYQADCGAVLDDYAAGLSALQTADGLSYSLLLTEHRTLLSEGRVTIGRLYGSDAEGYSGTLEAASQGSGRMYGSPEKGYTFTFSYHDGRTLSGSFSGSALWFTVASAEETELFCSMEKAGDEWLSTACNASYKSELTVRLAPGGGDAPVRFGLLAGDYLPAIGATAAPAGE